MKAVDEAKAELVFLSEEIWKNPELGLEEHKAHALLTDYLEKKGFAVERQFCGIETAFRARFGTGRPNVCVICEYDALPDIGHACGHNLIAEVGIAAGLGVKAFIESKGEGFQGTVTVIGAPAEENIGGKVMLIERGGFVDIDIAAMAHPASNEVAMPNSTCIYDFEVIFEGKAAHAAAFPWEGINALDAAVLAYTNISALRQQMKPTWRVHGVFTNGGAKPNIIPEKASLNYYVRADTREELKILTDKVLDCIGGAAKATGCTYKIRNVSYPYENTKSNTILAGLYCSHMKSFGVNVPMTGPEEAGSTDMGNVSHIVPSIHPHFDIDAGDATYHTRPFTAYTNTQFSHAKSQTVAKALALICIDVLDTGGDELLKKVKEEFNSGKK